MDQAGAEIALYWVCCLRLLWKVPLPRTGWAPSSPWSHTGRPSAWPARCCRRRWCLGWGRRSIYKDQPISLTCIGPGPLLKTDRDVCITQIGAPGGVGRITKETRWPNLSFSHHLVWRENGLMYSVGAITYDKGVKCLIHIIGRLIWIYILHIIISREYKGKDPLSVLLHTES